MLCRLANFSSAETDFVEPGSTTTSGLCAANHLSPEYFSRMDSLKKTSPAGRSDLSLERIFDFGEFMTETIFNQPAKSFGGLVFGIEKFAGFGGFSLRHLYTNAARGLRIS